MTKTRSQTRNITIKKEEEDHKDTQLLHSVNNTTGNSSKITKRKPPKNNTRNVPAQQIKVEEDTDTKSLLKSTSKLSKLSKSRSVSQEQINQLIDYVVSHGTTLAKAARAVKISYNTARHYYTEYKRDPEKKIPLPRNQRVHAKRFLTQEQIENLIRDIVDDKMPIPNASAKANMACESGRYYYKKYLADPNRAIPVPKWCRYYTQDQKNEFLGYVVNDKMSMMAASEKAKISVVAGKRYYHKYFDDQNPDIPTPSHITTFTHHTQEQISKVISYIIDDKMSIKAAGEKVNMNRQTAGRHYRRYLKDNNMGIPGSKSKYGNRYKQEEKDQLISLIVDEKMTIVAAGKKTGMSYRAASRHYSQYLKDNNLPLRALKYTSEDARNKLIGYIFDDKMSVKEASEKAKIPYNNGYGCFQRYLKKHNLSAFSTSSIATPKYTQDKINELIGYIVDDKMTVTAASKRANMSYSSGKRYYLKYRRDHNIGVPAPKSVTQDQINQLTGYVVDDKMPIYATSKKANMNQNTGYKHYRRYLNNQKRNVPARRLQVVSAPEDE